MAIKIGTHTVGPANPVLIIAEAGVNHNGDTDLAKALVKEAKACGAQCVKFQTFKASRLAIEGAPKAEYQMETSDPAESQIAMLRKLELPQDAYASLLAVCEEEKILFLSTPYDADDADFLDGIGVPAFKVASAQIVEPAFLRHLARKRKPVILSTGMATFAEVDEAVRVVRSEDNDRIVVMQCTTNYPSLPEDTNIRAMVTMAEAFSVTVGYSDHTQTETACIAAVALGACVIEKHFTLDKNLDGPDQSSSADPAEFRRLVALIREAEAVRGSPLKQPVERERRNIKAMRRSIASSVSIPRGAVVTEEMLTYKRPGTGIPPSRLPDVVGRVATQDIPADVLMALEWLL